VRNANDRHSCASIRNASKREDASVHPHHHGSCAWYICLSFSSLHAVWFNEEKFYNSSMFLKTGDHPAFSERLGNQFACVRVRCLVRISSLEGSFSALAIEWENK
jgi:hypothetical protein